LLAFCESFAFVSLAVPATAILFGLGGLGGAAGLDFWPLWIAATLGAIAGDWLAYDLAFRFKDRILAVWPFAGHPERIARGAAFFQHWGAIAVFVGRFFGPLRAVVPVVAGLNAMPWRAFQLANISSAAVWATGVLTPGFLSVHWLLD
jgi:membrane protein DedA with SNARE-associated domain